MDLRVDLILRVEHDHGMSYGASKHAPTGEEFRCRCGVEWKGDGALKNGNRHTATEILAALDEAAQVA